MASNTMHNLTTLIKRLEAATSRLEDIASSTLSPSDAATNGLTPGPTSTIPTTPSTMPTPPKLAPPPLPPAVEGFDKLLNVEVKSFIGLSNMLGGLIKEQAASVQRAFTAQRKFLLVTTKAKKPDIQSSVYMEILKDLQESFGAVDGAREVNRGSPLSNHLATVSEGIPMLGWVTDEHRPADHVTEMLNAAQFYGNRVQKEYKDKDRLHVEWVQAYYAICKSLIAYIKDFYPSGMIWNNKDGVDAHEALRQVEAGDIAPPGPRASGPPPPPPPPPPLPKLDGPPPPPPMPTGASGGGGAADMGAVFEQLSKGSEVTAGLRKVDPSQQTHKNPSLRAQKTVPPTRSDSLNSASSRGKSPVPGKKPDSMRTKKPPRKILEGNKWLVENYDTPSETVEIEARIGHSILITRCTKLTLRVLGKANAISIDSSSSVSLIIDSLVSSVDVIKSPKFALQVLGSLPTVLLDQVDGATLYLGEESLGTEVFTSKCTGINVDIPPREKGGDYRECAVPEQIKTVVRDGGLVSEIVEHAG